MTETPSISNTTVNQPNTHITKPPIPVYIPTPKHILEAKKSNGSTKLNPPAKRPKLEYVPKAITNQNEPIPTYIPSSVPNPTAEYEPAPIFAADNPISDECTTLNTSDDIANLLTELTSEPITNNVNHIEIASDTTKDSIDVVEKKSKENNHKSSSSSSSSSKHRHHSSSHKSSHSERKSSSSSSKSSSSTHKSSHHSSSRKSKHSDKDKDKDKDKSKHSSKSSKEGRHKSEHRSKSSSSSSSSRHHSSSHSDKNTYSSNNNKDCINSSVVYETESEEDDIEAQCRMIFDEFDASTVEIQPNDMPNNTSTEEDETSTKFEDVTKKKRVAHDNADKNRSMASFRKQTDHVKNALQVLIISVSFFHIFDK